MGVMRIVRSLDLSDQDRTILFQRRGALDEIVPAVREIMGAVRAEGDAALRRFTEQFDGVRLEGFRGSEDEIDEAERRVDPVVKAALERALTSVRAFHEPQLPHPEPVETAPGVRTWREWRPIERVGLYIPGGRGAYPSSVIMLGVPAAIAGCPHIVLCTPPDRDGSVPAATLAAARLAGITHVFKLGGAQAIAAMAYGTESVPRVDKLFGAGNAYVTAAKLLAFPECALDSPAGPSELLIIADDTADAAAVAADLLSDVEHGSDSPAVLATPSAELAQAVEGELQAQLSSLPRAEIARAALADRGLIVVTGSLDAAIDLANEYAPEHLEIVTVDAHTVLTRIRHAGSVFLGGHSPNAAGDYATGTNHVLPTARYARTFAPVSVESFGRLIQCQELTQDGLRGLAPTITTLAREEGLEGHARAVETRLTRGNYNRSTQDKGPVA